MRNKQWQKVVTVMGAACLLGASLSGVSYGSGMEPGEIAETAAEAKEETSSEKEAPEETPVEEASTEEAPSEETPSEDADLSATADALEEAVPIEGLTQREQLVAGYYSLALEAINAEDYALARKYLDMTAMYCDPEANAEIYADVLLKRGCLDVIDGDLGIALEQLDEAESYWPELAEIYLVKAQIYTTAENYEEGAAALESYISLTGDEAQNETLALLYQAAGDGEAALHAYETYAESGLGDEQAVAFQTAVYQMDAGFWDEAEEAFTSFLEDETYGLAAQYNIAVTRLRAGQYKESKEAFDAVVEAGGYYEGLYYNRGIASMLSEDYAAAAEDFSLSVVRQEFVLDATFNQGICYMQDENYERACEIFTNLIDSGAENTPAGAWFYRASCYEQLGEKEKAIADYDTCIMLGYNTEESTAAKDALAE
ncbi:MAG: tetratricopeptide repeat protein [Blautia sp.]|nr:tetratricopeptide repeat protein [Blautia sp.]